MHRRIALARTAAVFVTSVVTLFVPAVAAPQAAPDSPPPTSGTPGAQWSASAGYETLSLRDIARTSRPVTASPVSWSGSGPALRGRVAWDNIRRLHQIDFGGSVSGDFEHRGPVNSTPTFDNDAARFAEVRYEYRRYPFRDLMFSGFDVGFGAEGLGAWTSFTKHVAPATEISEWRLNGGVGGSIVARVARRHRFGGEVVWTNGLQIGRRGDRWTTGSEASGGGGGWLTTLNAQASVHLRGASALFVNYTHSGEGFLASHRSYALVRQRVSMGVTYGR